MYWEKIDLYAKEHSKYFKWKKVFYQQLFFRVSESGTHGAVRRKQPKSGPPKRESVKDRSRSLIDCGPHGCCSEREGCLCTTRREGMEWARGMLWPNNVTWIDSNVFATNTVFMTGCQQTTGISSSCTLTSCIPFVKWSEFDLLLTFFETWRLSWFLLDLEN